MKKLFFTVLALAGLLCAAAQTQDWANFGRFEQANGQVRNPKVVLMGNSITELWIKTHPDFFAARGYVSRGISGQTTSQMLVRFRADVLDLHPQVVVICGGTNDIAQNTGYISLPHILGNLVSMVELARANGIAPVLCSLLPAREFGWRKELEPAPLIIELKAERGNHAALAEATCRMLDRYRVHYCIESFDPRCLIWLKKNRPEIVRGQLSEQFLRHGETAGHGKATMWLLGNLFSNIAAKPDFIAYRFSDRDNLCLRWCRKFYHVQEINWTIRTKEEMEAAEAQGNLVIFECFDPKG